MVKSGAEGRVRPISTRDEENLPRGIQRSRRLPDSKLGTLWDSIVVDESLKNRLLSQAALNFILREKIDRTVLPLHGLILLVGPPGTGKTSLALGAAHRVAESFNSPNFRLLEVDAHSLTSSAMGKTQRTVSDLFSQAVAEVALRGPTIVLLDEIETLAVDRAKLSLEANPVDIHRATDAVLVQLDALSETHRNLLFIATSNVPKMIDAAFVSRSDRVLHVPLPNREACDKILRDTLSGLGNVYAAIGQLTKSQAFMTCVDECVGFDGRTIRKVVSNALANSLESALDPNRVTIDDLLMAAREAKANRQGDAAQ